MKSVLSIAILFILLLLTFGFQSVAGKKGEGMAKKPAMEKGRSDLLLATFAGGCFWCVEADFEKIDGVVEAVSGYTGGHMENPIYEEVSSGRTGHLEAVQVLYDPGRISYKELLDVFWTEGMAAPLST